MILCPTLLFSEGRGQWKPRWPTQQEGGELVPEPPRHRGVRVTLCLSSVPKYLTAGDDGARGARGVTLCSRARPGPARSICPHPLVSPALPSSCPGPQGKARNCTVCAEFLPQEGSWQPAGPGRWPSCSLSWNRIRIRRPGLSLCVPRAGGLRKPVAGGGQCLCPAGRPEGVAAQLQAGD